MLTSPVNINVNVDRQNHSLYILIFVSKDIVIQVIIINNEPL